MSDSDFGFDGGQSDLDFGFDGSSSSSDDEEAINAPPVAEDILVEAQIDDSSGDDDIVATAEIVTTKHPISREVTRSTDILCLMFHEGTRIGTSTWHP